MGFFSKLVNKITGGGAKVIVTADSPKLTGPFKVNVKAVVSDNDLKIEKAYLYLRSIEKTRVRNVDFPATATQSSQKRDVNGEEEVSKTEFVVAPAQTLTGKQEYDWSVEIQLPPNALPTYTGKNAWYDWEILAGLDAPGNDPDSGWVKIDVR
jgi:hypothetical protein